MLESYSVEVKDMTDRQAKAASLERLKPKVWTCPDYGIEEEWRMPWLLFLVVLVEVILLCTAFIIAAACISCWTFFRSLLHGKISIGHRDNRPRRFLPGGTPAP
jgi:hypothetical protein